MPELPQINSIRTPDATLQPQKQPVRRFKYLNIPLIISVILLVGFGLVVCWSAVYYNENYSITQQFAGVGIGAIVMMVIWRFDYRMLSDMVIPLLIITVVLIMLPHVPGLGVDAKGATSWIKVFGQQVQPGEFAKIMVIILAASLVSRYGGKLDDLREYLKVLGILAIPFVCIMTQPDLGTGMVYLFISIVALVVGGARVKYLLVTAGIGIALVAGVILIDPVLDSFFGSDVLLKDYQLGRLLVFIDPSYDPTGDGYNLAQAKIAIGSGGVFGKGLLQATQSTYGYLPEAPTDFIFCVLAEELGFFGVLVLIALYVALILVCFRIASSSANLFGTLIVMCIVGMWLFQILENIGMTCGLMPITGIPLPFMSYGSSFMLVNFILLGLVGSVWAHSDERKRA